ncbi:unnamed protein product, partial [Nesidiocoris tenuis]
MADGGGGADLRAIARSIRAAKRQLKNYGTQITNIRNKGFSAVSSAADRGIFRGMYATVETFYSNFTAKWEELAELHDQENAEGVFPSAEEENYHKEISTNYFEIHNYHIQINSRNTVPTGGGHGNQGNLDLTVNQQPAARAILPKIQIPKFGGDITQWPTFKQLFISLFRDEPSLTDSERFHYLLGHLVGPAHDCVKHIAAVGENFELAWAALHKVYDSPRRLASTYLSRFLGHRPHTGRPTAESLREYIANVSESIASLRNLEMADLSEYILCELALRSLDPYTREAFETSIVGTVFPQFTTLQEFVQNRCQVLSITNAACSIPYSPQPARPEPSPRRSFGLNPPNRYQPRPSTSRHALMAQSQMPPSLGMSRAQQPPPPKPRSCFLCQGNHTIANCTRFRSATPQKRLELLRNFHGCMNCLSVFHKVGDCSSVFNCQMCRRRHHTDLHLSTPHSGPFSDPGHQPPPSPPSQPQPSTSSGFAGAATHSQSGVLLGTITAALQTEDGQSLKFRGVLDPGSQYSFITEECAQKLRKVARPFRGRISGVDQTPLRSVRGLVSITFIPPESTSTLSTEAVVVPSITPPLPQFPLRSASWDYYLSYDLSDRSFAKPGPISFLIGADIFPEVVTGAPITLLRDGPRMIPTIFGLTLLGRYAEDAYPTASVALLAQGSLAVIMEKFWEIEEPSFSAKVSPEDEYCEQHFMSSHHRAEDGRYVVALPFRSVPPSILPNTLRAMNCFYALEKRLAKDSALREEYVAQMDEYIKLGHMTLATSPPSYIIPHHAVFKTVGDKKKLRIVFDASFPAPSGSLNDHLYTGARLQADLPHILLNFRRHQYVFSCDIIKMFRQIWINAEDRKYLQIAWRSDPQQPVQLFELTTVTFGLSSSPFLAQRVLRQHALNYQEEFPEASAVILQSTYIDDITAGSDSLACLTRLKSQLIRLLRIGGFELSKWSSNHPTLVDSRDQQDQPVRLGDADLPLTKILGMKWDPSQDVFSYDVSPPPPGNTRRILLSTIARLYDPLGYLAPVVFYAKKLLQLTWISSLRWDDELPNEISQSWRRFVDELPALSEITIARALAPSADRQLVCFSDASTSGYCAVAYLRTVHGDEACLTLLKAKTKLAPLKSLTVPRLELCGALLLGRLVESLSGLCKDLGVSQVHCFTDSTTVLAWLQTPPHLLHIFVSNRVQQILHNTQPGWWQYIKGVENPADVGSRGIAPAALREHSLWWHGPRWCRSPVDQWP